MEGDLILHNSETVRCGRTRRMTKKNSEPKFDILFLSEKIKSNAVVVLTMHDNDVFHEHVKWFTDDYLETQSGKLINRQYIKIIQ